MPQLPTGLMNQIHHQIFQLDLHEPIGLICLRLVFHPI